MAGITNVAFRRLCREQGGGLYVCEMITTRALVERIPKTLKMIAFAEDEDFRSLQLYGVDPEVTAAAVRMVAEEGLADHIDLNFGCPVPKVTRRGGGSALPWRRKLFGRIVRQAVAAAAPAGVPVTIKMRKGIDDDHLTYVEAGLIAQDAGVAAVALHARTAEQRYSGTRRLGCDRHPQAGARRAGAGQRRHLGGLRRAAHGRRTPASTAWWSAAAAWAGRGCSPTWRPRSPARHDAGAADPGRGRRRSCPGTRTCWSTRWATRSTAAPTSASTSPGT